MHRSIAIFGLPLVPAKAGTQWTLGTNSLDPRFREDER
jgi:hypothetical protein